VHPHQMPTDLIELAAAHLRMAAVDASQRSFNDAFSPWHAYAGQLDLAAAALSTHAGLTPQVTDHAGVLTHVELAIRALDQVPPGDGPADVALWCWQLEQLRRAAKQMAAA
jgi:hypothetical protein